MRKVHWAPFVYFVVVVLLETLHTSGVAILFYAVLPNLDTPRAMMVTNAVLIIPGFLSIFRPGRSSSSWKSNLGRLLDILSALFQIAGLIVWPLLNSDLKSTNVVNDVINVWALPVGIFLTSFGWWESFVDENSWNPLSKYLWRVKINMIEEGTRYAVVILKVLLRY
jgi:chitin synthase